MLGCHPNAGRSGVVRPGGGTRECGLHVDNSTSLNWSEGCGASRSRSCQGVPFATAAINQSSRSAMSELAAFSTEAPDVHQTDLEALAAQLKMAREEVQNVRRQLTDSNARATGEHPCASGPSASEMQFRSAYLVPYGAESKYRAG